MYRFLSILTVLIIISTVPIVSSEVIRGESTVPDWVKNTAGWWASEQIPDSAFLQGIQYLIKEGIMIVEIPAEIDSEAAEEIPNWVKNTAGWWAEDKIHDTTFVSGIKYLIGKGILVVMEPQVEEAKCNFKGKEVVCSLTEKEVVEISDFYMEVNSGSCSTCVSWAYVGKEYNFQIETYDEKRGNYIDGVEINVKIISKGGELRHNFGQVTTEDGIYKNSITIPSLDWYAENILSVTGEYYGVEKTIEKEFTVFKKGYSANQSSTDAAQNSGGSCTEVSPLAINSKVGWPGYTFTDGELLPNGLAFSEDGTKMFVVGKTNDTVFEYILGGSITNSSGTFSFPGPYCLGTAHKIAAFEVYEQEIAPSGIAFSNDGLKMFIVGEGGSTGKVYEYTLTENFVTNGTGKGYGFSTSTTFVDAFDVSSEDNSPQGLAFSNDGRKMFIVGSENDNVYEFTLSENFDVSTASFVDAFDVSSQEVQPQDVVFDYSGRYMFILGKTGDDVTVYKLSEPFDVSTAVVQSG